MVRCRIWLPAVQLVLFVALTWCGSPYREIWHRWILGAPKAGWEPSYIDGPPSALTQLAVGINFPAAAVAVLLTGALYEAPSGAARGLAGTVTTMPLLIALWFYVGRQMDRRHFPNAPPRLRAPRAVGAVLLSLFAALLIAARGTGVLPHLLVLTWVLYGIFLLTRGTTWAASPWLAFVAGAVVTVGQALSSYHLLEFLCAWVIPDPPVPLFSRVAWAGLLTAPPLAVLAGRLLARRWRSVGTIVPTLLCPLALVLEYFASTALSGNWSFVTRSTDALELLCFGWMRVAVLGAVASAGLALMAHRAAVIAGTLGTRDSQTPALFPPAGARP